MGNLYGILELSPDGNALFVPMDPRFPKMYVLEVSSSIDKELYHP
jgi:hypothetical protein